MCPKCGGKSESFAIVHNKKKMEKQIYLLLQRKKIEIAKIGEEGEKIEEGKQGEEMRRDERHR